jgi:glyoxalase family protein
VGGAHPWDRSPVPAEHQIRGLGPVTISAPDLAPTEAVLTHVLGMTKARDYATPGDGAARTHVFQMNGDGPGAELHVAVEPNLSPAQPGAGGVHHVAFRVANQEEQHYWRERISGAGLNISPVIDRYYFQSIYFRISNGILFEIATDGPGFATDEALDSLGETLALPPFLEDQREQIEAGLKPIEVVRS